MLVVSVGNGENRPERDIPLIPGNVSDAATSDVPVLQAVLTLSATSGRSQKSIVARFSVSPNLKGDVYDLRSTELPLSMPTSNSSEIEQLPDTTLLMVPGSTD